jgi:ATP-dependent DNA ligase
VAGWPVGLRRAAGPATVRPGRVRDLAAAAPAAFVVFDLLADRGTDLRGHPYIERRAALETLLGRGLPPGVVLSRVRLCGRTRFLRVLITEESDRHGETAGVPGRGEGPDRSLDPGR